MPADLSLPVCTVLRVENDPGFFELIQLLLGMGSGVQILGAALGELGLCLARERSPDLVLLNLQLPDLPGEIVLRRLKADERTRWVPVIVLRELAANRIRLV